MTVSRLAERLKELLNARGLTQAEVVRRSEGIDKYVSKGTVSTYLSNPPLKPKRQVIEAFAEILDVPVSDLEEAATFTGREPFVPDPSADRLTPPQRTVLNELIRVMTDANEKGGEGNAGDPAPMNPAGGSPAPNNVTPFPETQVFTDPPAESEAAAKRGKNAGRSIRREQDEDAERPDPDPNED